MSHGRPINILRPVEHLMHVAILPIVSTAPADTFKPPGEHRFGIISR